MNPIKHEVLRRLLLAKALLARVHASDVVPDPDEFTYVAEILTSHDAAEISAAALVDHLGLAHKKAMTLMDCLGALRAHFGGKLDGYDYLRRLNAARGELKHQGIVPSMREFPRVAERVRGYIADWCSFKFEFRQT